MTTNSSRKAYFDTANRRKRVSIRKQCYDALKERAMTCREVSAHTGLTYNQVSKRISDLYLTDFIDIIGEVEENGQKNSVYKACAVVPMFEVPYLTLKEWLKLNHPTVYTEYMKIKRK